MHLVLLERNYVQRIAMHLFICCHNQSWTKALGPFTFLSLLSKLVGLDIKALRRYCSRREQLDSGQTNVWPFMKWTSSHSNMSHMILVEGMKEKKYNWSPLRLVTSSWIVFFSSYFYFTYVKIYWSINLYYWSTRYGFATSWRNSMKRHNNI